MKKKNLLALGALCLSLGLVVSSCNNTPEKGDPGTPGQDGKPGVDGKDGKTYVDVIIQKGAVEGGTVKQDVYFVTEGAHDKITFTFEPKDEDDNIIVGFEINGQPVTDLEPGQLTYTIEDADVYKGSIQITGGEFTNANTYGKKLIENYYKTLVESDNQLDHTAEEGEEAPAKGQWWNSDVLEVVTEYQGKIDTTIAALEDDATVADKLAAVDPVVTEAKSKIDTAYSDALTLTKQEAKEALEDLADTVTSDNFKEEDAKTVLDEGKAAIDAATTIAGVTAIVNNVTVESKLEEGTYNKLYARKSAAFTLVENALEDAYEAVPELEDKEDTSYSELKTALATWDINLDEVSPSAVAEEYLTKISAAKTLEEIPTYTEDSATGAELTYKKGDVILGVEGADAVTGSVDDLKDTLVANIRASYEKEVDDSKVISSDTSKTAIKGLINNTIDTWVNVAETNETPLIEFTSAEEKGLIATIEGALAKPDNANYNAAFQAERLQNALADAKTTLSALAKAETDADSDYAKAIAWSEVTTSGEHEGDYLVSNPKIGETGYEVENPFVEGLPSTEPSDKKWYATGLAESEDLTVTSTGAPEYKGYSVNDYLDLLFPTDGTTPTGLTSPLQVKQWVENRKDDFKEIHDAAKLEYSEVQKEEIGSELLEKSISFSGTYDTNTGTLGEKWKDLFSDPTNPQKEYTMTEVSSSRKAFETTSSLLFEDGDGLIDTMKAFVRNIEATDKAYLTEVYKTSDSTGNFSSLKETYDDLVDNVLKGTADEDAVKDFSESISDLYAEDVAQYKEVLKEILNDQTQNLISDATSASQKTGYQNRLQSSLTALENTEMYSSKGTSYTENKVSSIDNWFADSLSYIGNTTPNLMSDLELGTFDTWQGKLNARVAQLKSYVGNSDWGSKEKGQWLGSLSENYVSETKVDVTIGSDSVVVQNPKLIRTLKLTGDWSDGKLTYSINSVNDVDNFVNDVIKVRDFMEEFQGKKLNKAYEILTVLRNKVSSFANVSTGSGKPDATTLKTQFDGVIDTWLATADAGSREALQNCISFVATDNKITATIGEGNYGKFIACFFWNMNVTKDSKTTTFHLWDDSELNSFASQFISEINAITGIAPSTTSSN